MIKPFGDILPADRNMVMYPHITYVSRELKPCEIAWLKFKDMLDHQVIKPVKIKKHKKYQSF